RVVGRILTRRTLGPTLLHHLLGETVVIELPQRPVEVVGAADRAAGLHTRETRHRHRGELAQLLVVHVHERGEEHLGELLVAHPLAGPAAPLLAGYAARL